MINPSKFWVVTVNNYVCDASYSGKELKAKHKFPSFRQFYFIKTWEDLKGFKERNNVSTESIVRECLRLYSQTKHEEYMTRRTYTFDYNLPAENHISGRPDVYIAASAEWNEGAYYPKGWGDHYGRPIVINEGPVIEKLNKHLLIVVKDWRLVYEGIEKVAQDYFLDQYKPITNNQTQY